MHKINLRQILTVPRLRNGALVLLAGAWSAGTDAATKPAANVLVEQFAPYRSVIAHYHSSVTMTPDLTRFSRLPADVLAHLDLRSATGERSYVGIFRRLDNRLWYEEQLTPASEQLIRSKRLVESVRTVHTYVPERAETLVEHPTGKTSAGDSVVGSIAEGSDPPRLDSVMDVVFGVRTLHAKDFLSALGADAVTSQRNAAGSELTASTTAPGGMTNVWVFDTRGLPKLLTYQLIDTTDHGFVYEEIKCDSYALVGSVPVPKRITRISYGKTTKGDRYTSRTETVDVDSVEIDSPANTVDSFAVTWPKGSDVVDARVNQVFKVRSGERTLPDSLVFEKVKEQIPNTPPPNADIPEQVLPTAAVPPSAPQLLAPAMIAAGMLVIAFGSWHWLKRRAGK